MSTQNTSVMEMVGTPATDFKSTLKAAGLDWKPLEDKVAGLDTGVEMPKFKLLYRSDNQQPLGIVGKDYKATDPTEFLESQYEFADFVKGKVTRAGFLPDRSRAFSFVRLDDIQVKPKEQRQVGDVCGVYIYSIDGWDGGTPRKSRLYIERLKCKNGMRSKEIKSSLWVSHTQGMDVLYEKRWKIFLNEISTEVTSIRSQFQTLVEKKMTKDEMVAFAGQLLAGEGEKAEEKRGTLISLFSEGTGTRGATRWDAYNAVTEMATHMSTRRVRESSGRSLESNRFLGVLEKDTLSPRALELLLN